MRTAIVLPVVAAVLVTPTEAWAYVDPGTGSYLFQLAVAGALAGLYTLRMYWQSVKSTVRRLLKRRNADESARIQR